MDNTQKLFELFVFQQEAEKNVLNCLKDSRLALPFLFFFLPFALHSWVLMQPQYQHEFVFSHPKVDAEATLVMRRGLIVC